MGLKTPQKKAEKSKNTTFLEVQLQTKWPQEHRTRKNSCGTEDAEQFFDLKKCHLEIREKVKSGQSPPPGQGGVRQPRVCEIPVKPVGAQGVESALDTLL